MNIIKKYKNYILVFFISGILFTSLGAYAAVLIPANEVGVNSDKTATTNVQDALDELYTLAVSRSNLDASNTTVIYRYNHTYESYNSKTTTNVPYTATKSGSAVMIACQNNKYPTTYPAIVKVNGTEVLKVDSNTCKTITYKFKSGDVFDMSGNGYLEGGSLVTATLIFD